MIGKRLAAFQYWPHMVTLVIISLAFLGYRFFAYHYTYSNDSYVAANVINIVSLVSGPITDIYVSENQKVLKGQKLVQIDSLPYKYAMEEISQDQNYKQGSINKASYEKALYLYNHSLIKAPADGYITNFNLRPGQYLSPGQTLFALIESNHWWVLTRYRETALRLIHPGDRAKITIDLYPGKVFHGHVNSIAWGIDRGQATSSTVSPLAPAEATEDWIKIAQRFPVRIDIDNLSAEYPLRIGASATTKTYH
ncbi:MAG: HlyD family secretion protein [Tatlockia sp.]|nr:HlyD family secretion protein [Tatlockia sp.]